MRYLTLPEVVSYCQTVPGFKELISPLSPEEKLKIIIPDENDSANVLKINQLRWTIAALSANYPALFEDFIKRVEDARPYLLYLFLKKEIDSEFMIDLFMATTAVRDYPGQEIYYRSLLENGEYTELARTLFLPYLQYFWQNTEDDLESLKNIFLSLPVSKRFFVIVKQTQKQLEVAQQGAIQSLIRCYGNEVNALADHVAGLGEFSDKIIVNPAFDPNFVLLCKVHSYLLRNQEIQLDAEKVEMTQALLRQFGIEGIVQSGMNGGEIASKLHDLIGGIINKVANCHPDVNCGTSLYYQIIYQQCEGALPVYYQGQGFSILSSTGVSRAIAENFSGTKSHLACQPIFGASLAQHIKKAMLNDRRPVSLGYPEINPREHVHGVEKATDFHQLIHDILGHCNRIWRVPDSVREELMHCAVQLDRLCGQAMNQLTWEFYDLDVPKLDIKGDPLTQFLICLQLLLTNDKNRKMRRQLEWEKILNERIQDGAPREDIQRLKKQVAISEKIVVAAKEYHSLFWLSIIDRFEFIVSNLSEGEIKEYDCSALLLPLIDDSLLPKDLLENLIDKKLKKEDCFDENAGSLEARLTIKVYTLLLEKQPLTERQKGILKEKTQYLDWMTNGGLCLRIPGREKIIYVRDINQRNFRDILDAIKTDELQQRMRFLPPPRHLFPENPDLSKRAKLSRL